MKFCLAIVIMHCSMGHPFLWSQLSDFKFERINSTHGLSNAWIVEAIEDKLGFIWLGTEDGLFRFEGNVCKQFDQGTNGGILHDKFINDLEVSADGSLWIATHHGLYVRNSVTGALSYYVQHSDHRNNNILINSLVADKAGRIFYATRFGVYVIDSPGAVSRPLPLYSHAEVVESRLKTLMIDKSGSLWIGCENGVIAVVDTTSGIMATMQYPLSKGNRFFAKTLSQDKQGNIWIGTGGHGAYVYNPVQKRFVMSLTVENNALQNNMINHIYAASDGKMWLATQYGVYAFDTNTQSILPMMRIDNDITTLSNNDVFRIFEDSRKTIFFATSGSGLCILDKNPARIATYQIGSNGLSSHVVRAILEIPNNKVLIGTQKGIDLFDRTTSTITPLQPKFVRDIGKNEYTKNSIRSFLHVDAQRYLVATHYGLFLLNLRTQDFIPILPDVFYNTPAKIISTLYRDKLGTIWVATASGVFQLSSRLQLLQEFSPRTNMKGLQSAHVFSIMQDSKGIMWFATREGLHEYDVLTSTFTVRKYQEVNSKTPSFNEIWSLVEDSDGDIWAGTHSGGILVYNKQRQTFRKITTRDGLPNDVVYSLCRDTDSTIWVGTNIGIAQVYKKHDSLSVILKITEDEGLHGNECNIGALYLGHNQRLYVGGMKGISEFFPRHVKITNSAPPDVRIIGLKVFNNQLPTDTLVENKSSVVIPYSDNYITFQFLALSYARAYKNQYRFKLENYHEDWIDAQARNEAYFTNLAPGEYVFRVIAANANGVWNTKGASIRLIVLPPWWMTWWFRFFCAVLVITVIGSVFQYRTYSLRKNNHMLEALVRERTSQLQSTLEALKDNNEQLAAANDEVQRTNEVLNEQTVQIELHNTTLQDLNERLESSYAEVYESNERNKEFMAIAAHDIRNPLTNVILNVEFMMEHVKKFMGADTFLTTRLSKVYESAERIVTIVEHYLNIHRAELGDHGHESECAIQDMVAPIVNNMIENARRKEIVMQVHIEDGIIQTNTLLLTQIVENILSNAVKYSYPHSTITMTIMVRQGQCTIAVTDEGQGFSKEELPHVFQRYATLSSKPTQGEKQHGIGLSIVKRMVEALKGTIEVASSGKGKGSTFTIVLPTTQAKK